MPSEFRVGDWFVQADVGTVTKQDLSYTLEPKVMEVLVYLARHGGEVLPKERLIQAVWPDTFVTDWVLTHAISELRKTFGDSVDDPRYIQTLPKRGYRLIAEVEYPGKDEEESPDRYQLRQKLGQGAMAEVYLAEDQFLRRKVALKLPLEGIEEDEKARKLLIREARAAAALDHPYICKVYDTGELNGRSFIAMEYVEGQTLKKKLTEGRLSLSEALRIASEVAEALETAYEKGIVHRDIKPSNIMLTRQGHVKVTDFGVAKRLVKAEGEGQDLTATLTADVTTKGTLPYMSPEQLRAQTVDHRSDIFSLGVVLYEMLTGVNPFRRDVPMDTATAVLSADIPDISAYRTGTPELLQHTLGKMLARDPQRRYQSVHEVKTNLAQLIEAKGLQKIIPWSDPRRWMTPVLIGMGFLPVLTVGMILLWQHGFLSPGSPEHPPLQPVPFTSDLGLEDFPSFSPDGDEVAYVARPARQGYSGDVYVKRIGLGRPLKLTTSPAVYQATAWSPDGHHIAFVRPKANSERKLSVCLVPKLGGLEKEVAVIRDWGLNAFGLTFRPSLSWTSDSRWLAVSAVAHEDSESNTRSLFLLSVDRDEKRRLTFPPRGPGGWDVSPAFSPDGRSLAFVRTSSVQTGDLYHLPLSEDFTPVGKPERLTHMGQFVNHPTWTSDGREIIFSAGPTSRNARLWRIDRSREKEPEILPFAWTGALDPVISPAGDRLVYQQLFEDRNIYRAELSSPGEAAPAEKLIASSYREYFPSYSPDGSKIAFVSDRSGSPEIWVCDQDGENQNQVTKLGIGSADSPRWSPDGTSIAFFVFSASIDIYVVNAQGGEARKLTPGRMPRWSPDGEWIYFSQGGEFWKIPALGGEKVKANLSPRALRTDQTPNTWPEEGEEENLIPAGLFVNLWHRTETGIYYSRQREGLYYRDAESEKVKFVTQVAAWFSISTDGKSLLHYRTDSSSSNLMRVEGFR